MSEAGAFYSLVAAAPAPESGERVNVALVLTAGGRRWLETMRSLPRLACLVPSADLEVYLEVLDLLGRKLHEGESPEVLEATFGPHLSFSPPRQLYQRPTQDVISQLRRNYLGGPARSPSEERQDDYRREVNVRLDRLFDTIRVRERVRVARGPTPDKLYGERATRIFQSPVPALQRALRGERRDLLIGAVVVRDVPDPLGQIHGQMVKVGKAFWQYKEARDLIREQVGREVRTLGIVLNGHGAHLPAVQDAKAYITHLWQADADGVVRPEQAQQGEPLQEALAWVSSR